MNRILRIIPPAKIDGKQFAAVPTSRMGERGIYCSRGEEIIHIAVPTDQKRLSPSAVRLLAAEAISMFGVRC